MIYLVKINITWTWTIWTSYCTWTSAKSICSRMKSIIFYLKILSWHFLTIIKQNQERKSLN